jgi:RNA polymerase sigma-70 factor (ECF subfamily)
VAHNFLIDDLRREQRAVLLSPEGTQEVAPATGVDDELALIFLCCHPALSRAAQIALTLRVAYGFGALQIARAFLADERAIAQRIVRAKQTLRDAGALFEVPDPDELPARLEAILDVLYQVFTEGYTSTIEERGIDVALCEESLRLVRLLGADPRTATPAVAALHALLAFHAARVEARRADDGGLLLLHEQDRSRWNRDQLAEGFAALERASRGTVLSRFHLEAGIAACHASAPSHITTDWAKIVELYDLLRTVTPSLVVDVNRAFAVAMLRGARAGLDELDAIPERDIVGRYPYALACYADLHAAQGEHETARFFLDQALAHQPSPAERRLLERKRAALHR